MPPGFWHEVFTPVNTVVIGGHLYLWECMHLTEYHMFLDNSFSDYFTNTDHPGAYRGIIRMILALRHWDSDRGKFLLLFTPSYLTIGPTVMKKDCFIAASSIILQWHILYQPYYPSGINLKPTDCCSVEEDGERVAAIAFIEHVFKKMKIDTSQDTLAIEREVRHRMLPNVRDEVIDPAWFQIAKYQGESNRK
jgi:hypothetical protein